MKGNGLDQDPMKVATDDGYISCENQQGKTEDSKHSFREIWKLLTDDPGLPLTGMRKAGEGAFGQAGACRCQRVTGARG